MNIGSETVFEIVNVTLPHLREGLDMDSARETVRAIREKASVGAVAISDNERVLAFTGIGEDHHVVGRPPLTHLTWETLSSGKVRVARGRQEIGCPVPECPLRAAVVVPLRANGHIAGCLKLYKAEEAAFAGAEVEFAIGLSQMLSMELELAEIDVQKRLTTQAELRALQAQISPHFLFNTLNTIASFCRNDGSLAQDLLIEFSELFRRNLKQHRGLVSLREEIDFVESYLRFEKYRFGERLLVVWDCDQDTLGVRVPPLALQPLVENAVAHGVPKRMGVSTLTIESHRSKEDVVIAIQDDGPGMDPSLLFRGDSEGIGMQNVQRRLQGLFGHKYGLAVANAQQAVDVDAIDYLLKPISKDRLRKCIRKVVGRLHVSEGATYSEEIRSVTDASGQEESREHLTARQGHRMVLIATEDIAYVQVEREEVNIFTREDRYEAMVSSLDGLERALDASSFFRTHRNYLVNLRHVSEVVPMFNRTYELVMTDAQESRVPVSRRRAVDLRAALGF